MNIQNVNVKDSQTSTFINSNRDTIINTQNNTYNIQMFTDVISFFQSVARYLVTFIRNENTRDTDPVEISNIMAGDLRQLPITSIADRYTRSMLECMVGYPLYEPEPYSDLSRQYMLNGVNVGDVGFVREDGTFDFLFNICPVQGESINPHNLPPGFALPEHSRRKNVRPFPPGMSFSSSTVRKMGSCEYVCTGSGGAVLALPQGTTQEEAINIGPFEDLAKRHGVEWYKHAKVRGRSITNGSLYLVTSFVKCTRWGIAVFDRPCEPGQVLTFINSPLDWRGSGAFDTRVTNPDQGDIANQCVFLRGYKIMIRQDIFDELPTRQRASRIRGGGSSDPFSGIRNTLPWTRPSSSKKPEMAVLQTKINTSLVHPSDFINAELLSQNPDAKIALTHDDVWCDLLRGNFPNLDNARLTNIARSYTSTVDNYGCISLTKNVVTEFLSPIVSPVSAIQSILYDYPFRVSFLRELLKNSDDASATTQIFILDKDNPALIGYNDSVFREPDWQAVRRIRVLSKANPSKIGQHGVGFSACYHITDQPQILSGSFFAVLNPLNPKDTKITYEHFKSTEYFKYFNFFSNILEPNSFRGTAIRLPLRSTRSDLSQRVVRINELQQMVSEYIFDELDVSLLFFENIKKIEIWEMGNGTRSGLAIRTKTETPPSCPDLSLPLVTNLVTLSNGSTEYSWRIVRTQISEKEAIARLTQYARSDLVNNIVGKGKMRPDIRIAYPLTSKEQISGRLFTFLPLASKTRFPIHIHAPFGLSSPRRKLCKPVEMGIVQGSQKDILIKWNKLLFNHYIPQCWSYLLMILAEDPSCGDIWGAWPHDDDGNDPPLACEDWVYWQGILSNTFKVVVGSGLKVWPKLSASGKTIYVDLKSSVIVLRSQVDADVLFILAELGLTLVQLPPSWLHLVDDSMTKLSPSVAHAKLQGAAAFHLFSLLSVDQSALICEYLLSDNDISNIFGLPLLPGLNGSSVALDVPNKSLRHFVALTKDEARIFRQSIPHVILLDQLSPGIARLIREQGIKRANVDILDPRHVIECLSSGGRILSDEWLIEFWRWLGEWHFKTELLNFLKKDPNLHLMPTTKGPQSVSFPIFNAAPEMGNVQLFERLGLTFVTSVLPASVIHLLFYHDILKDANDLNHLLAAIKPASVPSLTNVEAQSIFRHVTSFRGIISADNLDKLRKLPIFPLLAFSDAPHLPPDSNTSVSWCRIDEIDVKGISPIRFIPLASHMHYLSGPTIEYPWCSVLRQLNIPVLKEDDILLHALNHLALQPIRLQAAFVSYIRNNQGRLAIVTLMLQRVPFLRTTNGSLQSPRNVIAPNSSLASLFPQGCKDSRVPVNEDSSDHQLFRDLLFLNLTKTKLDPYLVQERISYISANCNAPHATAIACSLVTLMNEPSFSCDGLSIDPNMCWLPTSRGLMTPKKCIYSGHCDMNLFDRVLFMLDKSISVSSSFKVLLDWDKPLPLEAVTEQLRHTLDRPVLEVQSQKICCIIRELASRQLSDADIRDIQTTIEGRPWIPTKSGSLTQHSHALFVNVDTASGFYEIAFPKADKEIYLFLRRMGCLEEPTSTAIIKELEGLHRLSNVDGALVQRAILLLGMLPNSMTEEEYQSVLVPDRSGRLIPLSTGICYDNGLGIRRSKPDERGILVAHHLVTEPLARKLRMKRPGVEVEDSLELRKNPITIIRNVLNQYDPQQFFIEFVANASDAKANQFNLLIDEGLTSRSISKRMKAFQGASLVVHNNSVFTKDDFDGILTMGTSDKKGKPNSIGYSGLGALSMFHFTEEPMIVSGSHVLFLHPARQKPGYYKGQNYVFYSLQDAKRNFPDYFEQLNGLFDFNLNLAGPYQGTIFLLRLRNQVHLDPVSTRSWQVKEVQDIFLKQFDNLSYKLLLFTGLDRIKLLTRRGTGSQSKILRSFEVTRVTGNHASGAHFKSEITTFKTTDVQTKWFVLSQSVQTPTEFENQLEKKYKKRHPLTIQLAAALDGKQEFAADRNLFSILPLLGSTSYPVHISAPFILDKGRRNIHLDEMGTESEFNRWLLSSEIPRLYLCLLEILLEKQENNMAWWPPSRLGMNHDDSRASQIIADAFWSPKIIGASPRKVFVSRMEPTTFLAPKDAVVLILERQKFFSTVLRILEISNVMNVVELPGKLGDGVSYAGLRIVNTAFVKNLLEDPQICRQMSRDEKYMALLFLCSHKISFHKLPLLPLEDGSFVTISLRGDPNRLYYVYQQDPDVALPPFRKNCLISRHFESFLSKNGQLTTWRSLLHNYNVSVLSDDSIIEFIIDYINPADEFVGNQDNQVWVDAFWNAQLKIPPAASVFPLVPTYKPLHYISLQKVTDPSVIILEERPERQSHYSVLQSLGLIVVVRQALPWNLRSILPKKRLDIYAAFLDFIKKNPEKLGILQQLQTHEQEVLGSWIRANFSHTPRDLSDITYKLPLWSVQQAGKDTRLAALSDDDVVILPSSMPANLLKIFTDQPLVDWERDMNFANKGPCTAQHILGLLGVFEDSVLRAPERAAYKEFVRRFMTIDAIGDQRLLVPNSESVLQRTNNLFEHSDLFKAAFKENSPILLSQDFQDLTQDLERYGLKRQCRLDLPTFIQCAKAFDSESDSHVKRARARAVVLYKHFNSLQLSSVDSERCSELDYLKFIPRLHVQRPGYENINILEYTADLPQGLLAPSQITLPEFDAICWSQKGQANPRLNTILCSTYRTLGRPNGTDVLAHLTVLAEMAQEHGRHSGLLSDLLATYKWLNDHANDITGTILKKRKEILFLNVDDPKSDDWTWHSASDLVIGLKDICNLHGVKGFLRNYNELLTIAGVRKIKKRTAKVIPTTLDKTISRLRDEYNNMRQSGLSTNVVFEAQDNQYRIPPAHMAWLAIRSNYFKTRFNASETKGLRTSESGKRIRVEYSSICVREVINWFYVGKLADFLISDGNNEEETKRLDLALDMLSLADEWEVIDLHEQLQVFIINDQGFINPYWVRRIQQHAEATKAKPLLEYCQRYEEENRSIIDNCTLENPEDDFSPAEDSNNLAIW